MQEADPRWFGTAETDNNESRFPWVVGDEKMPRWPLEHRRRSYSATKDILIRSRFVEDKKGTA